MNWLKLGRDLRTELPDEFVRLGFVHDRRRKNMQVAMNAKLYVISAASWETGMQPPLTEIGVKGGWQILTNVHRLRKSRIPMGWSRAAWDMEFRR